MCLNNLNTKALHTQEPTLEWAVVITLATKCDVYWNRNLVTDFHLVLMFTLQPTMKAKKGIRGTGLLFL